jgi:hypothetical protein
VRKVLNNLQLLLEGTHESLLFGGGLETTVTELGRGIDELELNLLESRALGVGDEGLADGDDTLLGTSNATLDHQEVLVDNTVVGETTHGSDSLVGDIELSSARLLVASLTNTVDLLVDLSTVVVTVLTSTGNRVHDAGRMPGTNTGNLTETSVGLAGKFLGTPTSGDTLETLTLGNGDDINHLVLLEEGSNIDFLLEVLASPVNLLGNGATVDLDLHNVSLLLTDLSLADLSVGNDADNAAVLLDTLEFTSDLLGAFSVLLGVLGESLLLGAVPVLVEAATDLVGKMLSPDGGKSAKTTGSLDVTNNTNDNHGGSLDDADSLDNLLLVHLGTRTVKIADDVSHTSLVTHEGSQVDGLGLVILGEGLDAATVGSATLARKETKMAVSGSLELSVWEEE